MNQRRLVVLGVGAVAAALVLSGCTTGGNASAPDEGGDGAGVLTIASIPNYQNSLPSVVEAFEKANPDIDVQLEFVDVAALHTQIRTQLSAGTAPDIFTTYPGNGTPTAMENLVPGGFLADMSDLDFSDRIPAGMDQTTMVDGKRYVLPLSLGAIGGIYNDTAMAEAGLTAPETWSDLLKFCGDAKAAGKVAYAYAAQTAWNNQLFAFPLSATLVYGEGSTFSKDQADGKATFADSEWTEVWAKVLEMQEAGCWQDEPLGTAYEVATDMVAKGDALAISSVTSTFAALTAAAPETTQFVFHALPATDDPDETWISAGGSGGYSINAKAKNPVAAQKFMEFLGSDAIMAEVAQLQNTLPSIASADFETPASLAEIMTYVDAERIHPYDDQLWPNAKVATVLMEQAQLLVGGSATIEQVLQAMDAAYAEGS